MDFSVTKHLHKHNSFSKKKKLLLKYSNLANFKDLLLLIAQLRQQLCEAMEELAKCEGHQSFSQGPTALFWLLVAMVATSLCLGGLRVLWHGYYDSRLIFDW